MNRRKKNRFTFIKGSLFTLFVCLLFMTWNMTLESTGDNFFHVSVNGIEVGTVSDKEKAEQMFREARRNVASEKEGLTFMDVTMSVRGEELLWGTLDAEETVQANMENVMRGSTIETLQKAYTLKYNDKLVTLASTDEIEALLQTAIDKYDADGEFHVVLEDDTDRELNVLAVSVVNNSKVTPGPKEDYETGGIITALQELMDADVEKTDKEFEDYELGTITMDFKEKMEVVESYLPASRISTLEEAKENVLAEAETAQIYTVKSGDTLSEIAITLNVPMDKIVEMNDSLADENSMLHVGQELVTMVPDRDLSVVRVEQNYLEEIYDEAIQVIEVPEWYTNQTEVVQQPSAGFRRIIADVTYENDSVVSRDILKEEIVMEAVPKIVKRGTKIPPTYIKPLSGGRLSSSFGPRKQPKPGASTNHKGIDWATPTGTSIVASCGGTVSKAGWGSGYGYVVYIDHEDGKQTRYGHLSKILVTVGQKVKQGDKIALSGNTGVSTGPHVHFEILVNGVKVDPMKYLNK